MQNCLCMSTNGIFARHINKMGQEHGYFGRLSVSFHGFYMTTYPTRPDFISIVIRVDADGHDIAFGYL